MMATRNQCGQWKEGDETGGRGEGVSDGITLRMTRRGILGDLLFSSSSKSRENMNLTTKENAFEHREKEDEHSLMPFASIRGTDVFGSASSHPDHRVPCSAGMGDHPRARQIPDDEIWAPYCPLSTEALTAMDICEIGRVLPSPPACPFTHTKLKT
eukprot:GHVS01063317.1.p1 GENE.GHVS01063317.1~~GHVS01063317.1.p1  ORF type:complete len:156 (-),score=15.93 GHVS01063317.1:13-480(-)